MLSFTDAVRGLYFRKSKQKKMEEALSNLDNIRPFILNELDAFHNTTIVKLRRDLLLVQGRVENIEFNLEKLMRHLSLSYEIVAPDGASDYDDYALWKLERNKKEHVRRVCSYVQSLSDEQCRDAHFLETNLVPQVGLAKVEWKNWAPEINFLPGRSLHMIQMPNQVAPYLAWLANNVTDIKSYLEIGVFRGGSFILFSEWLRRFNPNLKKIAAIDPIKISPSIAEYFDYLREIAPAIHAEYVQDYSTSQRVREFVNQLAPEFVFIDGDHSYEGVKKDFALVKDIARFIALHDIQDAPSEGPVQLWKELNSSSQKEFELSEFTETYPSISKCMGIGVMKRRVSTVTE